MKHKLISILILIAMLSCFFSVYTTNATSLSQQQEEVKNKKEEATQQLEYVKDELSEALVKIQKLDDTISQAQNEINEMDKNLTTLQEQVNKTTDELNAKQKEYDENEKLLEDRLVVMYEYGDVSYLDILLKSANLVDFLSNYYTLQEIVQNDTELLEGIEKEKQEVENTKKQLEEQKANLKLLKAKKEQTYVIMQNNKTIQQNQINQLSENEKELQTKIEEYKAEEQRIENLIKLASNEYVYTGEYSGGIMAWPIAKSGTYITSPYGTREHPIQGIIKMHTGIDIGNAGFGAPIIAAADGVVSMASYYGGYGNCVMINHGNGISTLYGHGQKILTTVGAEVKKGDLIMEVGSTGNSTGPHLHFEVRLNGSHVNPLPYLGT